MIEVDGTLKRRLGAWLLATVGVLGSLLLVEAYTSAQRAADRAFDSQLEAASLTITEAIQWQDGQPLLEIPAAAFQILATDQQERVFYALIDHQGRELTGNLDGLIRAPLQRPPSDGRSGDSPGSGIPVFASMAGNSNPPGGKPWSRSKSGSAIPSMGARPWPESCLPVP